MAKRLQSFQQKSIFCCFTKGLDQWGSKIILTKENFQASNKIKSKLQQMFIYYWQSFKPCEYKIHWLLQYMCYYFYCFVSAFNTLTVISWCCCFFFLVTAYLNQIDIFIQFNNGFNQIVKCVFWFLFRNAWKLILIASNIHASFFATGIWFFNLIKVLKQFETKIPLFLMSDTECRRKIPKSVRGVCCTIKMIRAKDFHPDAFENIICAVKKLSITADIQAHELKGFREALVSEKKCCKWNKTMKFFDKNKPKQAMFFLFSQIAAVKV